VTGIVSRFLSYHHGRLRSFCGASMTTITNAVPVAAPVGRAFISSRQSARQSDQEPVLARLRQKVDHGGSHAFRSATHGVEGERTVTRTLHTGRAVAGGAGPSRVPAPLTSTLESSAWLSVASVGVLPKDRASFAIFRQRNEQDSVTTGYLVINLPSQGWPLLTATWAVDGSQPAYSLSPGVAWMRHSFLSGSTVPTVLRSVETPRRPQGAL
jgi:hypothetical protein